MSKELLGDCNGCGEDHDPHECSQLNGECIWNDPDFLYDREIEMQLCEE